MTDARVLLIESQRASVHSFAQAIEVKGFHVQVMTKLDQALAAAAKEPPDLVVLDAASMRTSGTRMCRKIRECLDCIPIILVSPEGSEPDLSNGANITLVHPFTPRKLLNRLQRLLPGDERYVIEAGPLKLDLAKRCVTNADGEDARLTPKQSKLLEVFMLNPGKMLTRKTLIRRVWHTDYTGDTRTLDVHMSWLRNAVESDPRNPKFLKTIRGMGYRFDPPES